MRVTSVKVRPVSSGEKLRAFASVGFDNEAVIEEYKLIESGGQLQVYPPSRKLVDKCPECNGGNRYQAAYCNWCSAHLGSVEERAERRPDGRLYLHTDIFYVTSLTLREEVKQAVISEYRRLTDVREGEVRDQGSP